MNISGMSSIGDIGQARVAAPLCSFIQPVIKTANGRTEKNGEGICLPLQVGER